MKFPPIDKDIYEKEGMKELYIFKDPDDPFCPVIFHFVLINLGFKEFKAPGNEPFYDLFIILLCYVGLITVRTRIK